MSGMAAARGWSNQLRRSLSPATGMGPLSGVFCHGNGQAGKRLVTRLLSQALSFVAARWWSGDAPPDWVRPNRPMAVDSCECVRTDGALGTQVARESLCPISANTGRAQQAAVTLSRRVGGWSASDEIAGQGQGVAVSSLLRLGRRVDRFSDLSPLRL
jgi:hypothetical protein